ETNLGVPSTQPASTSPVPKTDAPGKSILTLEMLEEARKKILEQQIQVRDEICALPKMRDIKKGNGSLADLEIPSDMMAKIVESKDFLIAYGSTLKEIMGDKLSDAAWQAKIENPKELEGFLANAAEALISFRASFSPDSQTAANKFCTDDK